MVPDDVKSYPRRIAELAREMPDTVVYRHIGVDGDEPGFTWPELDRWSTQVAGVLAERGLGLGDRLALGLRNSPEFLVTTFAAWKVGATPVPVRWDVPEWERERVQSVIDAKVVVGEGDLDAIRAARSREPTELADVVAPYVNGICSSGSTGTPKVIVINRPAVFSELHAVPMAALWGPVPTPQTILVLAPMYHINAFATLMNLLGGDRLVALEKFDAGRILDVIERYRVTTFTATPTMLKRIADVPGVDDRDLSSLEWFLQGAAPMPPSLVDRWAELIGAERIVMAYGQTEAIGLTALRGDQ